MQTQTILDDRLDEATELDIIRALCDNKRDGYQLGLYQSFLAHYKSEIRRLKENLRYRHFPSGVASQSHQDVLSLVRFLSENRDVDIEQICERVSQHPELSKSTGGEVRKSIELALRVWLTINVRSDSDVRTDAPRHEMPEKGTTLSYYISSLFPIRDTTTTENTRFKPDFKIASVVAGCGLNLVWTSCLRDHLRVDRVKKTVRIYHLKQVLDDHLHSRGSAFSSDPANTSATTPAPPLLPGPLLRETIHTLNLLFPEDTPTALLLESHRRPHPLLRSPVTIPPSLTPNKILSSSLLSSDRRPTDLNMSDWTGPSARPLDSNAYVYWGEQLLELYRIYEEGPSTLRQYLAYQKPYQVFNWVAAGVASVALALIFGLVSSITAVVSMKAGLDALEVAREALELQRQVPICPCDKQ